MIDRQDLEKREYELLSPFAQKALETKGRDFEEEKCEFRTDFQRDRDRIIHSKAFRRLMHKTQVFLAPEEDHFRTRLTHTLEVAQISRTIARGLGLNEDLTEAIALGHDLGHTPFGHSGESALNAIHPGGFKHNVQSLRVVEVLEQSHRKRGMNLTYEVRDGILNHTGSTKPITLEGQIVKTSDRIAYINHDIDDAIRNGVIKLSDLPKDCLEFLGIDHRTRINTLVRDMIESSDGKPEISMSKAALDNMNSIRAYMFENVYLNPKIQKYDYATRVDEIIEKLYLYYVANPEKMPKEMFQLVGEYEPAEIAKDFVAGMTDRYADRLYRELILKK